MNSGNTWRPLEPNRVQPAPDVLLQDLDGEAVLLNLRNGQYYGLDEISFRMYQVLLASENVEEAYDQLTREYDVGPERLREDLQQFLRRLLDNGLLQPQDVQSPQT